MRDKALVIKYENGIATVKPLLSDTCINCNSSTCSHKSSVFVATNPKQLPVKPGSLVKIGASVKSQIVQTIFFFFFSLMIYDLKGHKGNAVLSIFVAGF